MKSDRVTARERTRLRYKERAMVQVALAERAVATTHAVLTTMKIRRAGR